MKELLEELVSDPMAGLFGNSEYDYVSCTYCLHSETKLGGDWFYATDGAFPHLLTCPIVRGRKLLAGEP